MRILRIALLLGALPLLARAQGPQIGIQVADLDTKVNACTDFFEFANGGWRAANPIPPSMSRWSRRWQAGEQTKDLLSLILQETAAAPAAPKGSTEQLIGDFYGACMDSAARNAAGAKPVQPMLAKVSAIKDRAGVEAMIREFAAIGISAPFAFFGSSDNHDPGTVIANVAAAGLGLPDRDYYLKPEPRFQEARAKYVSHVASAFRLAGYDGARAKAASEVVMRMETQLARASLDNVALRDPAATDHKTSFPDLRAMTPNFSWPAFYERAGLPMSAINVTEPKFLAEFNTLLASAPVADWKTYLSWQLLATAAPSLSDPFVSENFAFTEAFLNGTKAMKPRATVCAEATDTFLGEALGRKYVEKYFPPAAKQRVQEMVKNLLAAMDTTIKGLDWMSAETKQKALEKLSTFNPKIGYPDKWLDYSSVVVTRRDYWNDIVNGSRFLVRDNLSQIGKPVDRGRFGMTPPTSNAYYNPRLNEIVFPAGILVPPAFNMQANDAVNYGAIGVVIGHEVSHGFDDQGAQYDAQGKLNNWWTTKDLDTFHRKTACVVSQFDGYFVEPGIHENGKLVLGESIGDLAGARIALRAFKLSQIGKPPMPDVDGFTPDQQFFIAWGQFRGDAVRPEQARSMVQGDPHPIGKYRVIGPLSNLPEFAKAFSCPDSSAMVRPVEVRCDVW